MTQQVEEFFFLLRSIQFNDTADRTDSLAGILSTAQAQFVIRSGVTGAIWWACFLKGKAQKLCSLKPILVGRLAAA